MAQTQILILQLGAFCEHTYDPAVFTGLLTHPSWFYGAAKRREGRRGRKWGERGRRGAGKEGKGRRGKGL